VGISAAIPSVPEDFLARYYGLTGQRRIKEYRKHNDGTKSPQENREQSQKFPLNLKFLYATGPCPLIAGWKEIGDVCTQASPLIDHK